MSFPRFCATASASPAWAGWTGFRRKSGRNCRTAIDATAQNTGMRLNVAINYSGRAELVDAINAIVADARLEGRLRDLRIDEEVHRARLYTAGLPDPDLLIRTSGEMRISNFLLWQIAYAELYVTDTLWPDFRRMDLLHAIPGLSEARPPLRWPESRRPNAPARKSQWKWPAQSRDEARPDGAAPHPDLLLHNRCGRRSGRFSRRWQRLRSCAFASTPILPRGITFRSRGCSGTSRAC